VFSDVSHVQLAEKAESRTAERVVPRQVAATRARLATILQFQTRLLSATASKTPPVRLASVPAAVVHRFERLLRFRRKRFPHERRLRLDVSALSCGPHVADATALARVSQNA